MNPATQKDVDEIDINYTQINLVNVTGKEVKSDTGTKMTVTIPSIIVSEQGYVDFVNEDAEKELITLKDSYELVILNEDEYLNIAQKKIGTQSFDIEIAGVGHNVDDDNNDYYYLVINSKEIDMFRDRHNLHLSEMIIPLYGENMPDYVERGMGTLLQFKDAVFSSKA